MKIPAGAVITGHLIVVEYMDSDGGFHLKSECFATGNEELPFGKTLELIEYAKVRAIAPILAEAVSGYFDEYEFVEYDDGEDEDEEVDDDSAGM